ncbi:MULTISPECIES: DUF6065 family protein [Micromonospora]|uniref:Uncharacterized protein n=1 Tax=Micromonospora solifontis TaxID=2487138 RepID=A0ABX9WHM6_9ACTN|nr:MULTISPECIES: DUF6065 family protein [Micromonospora]NES12569.1 hypothetical protein [Micromonospora sp. PPF5-17B]NES36481.1 hypothetical protein [Micromonospora solifontis]NES54546.1 hypothetical protein [Micromonospora sp. PPF5-6]RNL99536.1 hypothetical protein EFE23_09950 [Micromonospora solifontis]
MTGTAIEPLRVEIYSLYAGTRPAEAASPSLRGSLPIRAVQHCPPVAAGSGLGWYVHPPADFALRWDGQDTEWTLLEENEPAGWRSLAGGYDAKLPFAADELTDVPEAFRADLDIFDRYGGSMPFIDADPRAANMIELVTGVVARTSPGWCLLARGVPNWPLQRGVQIYDGVVETDWYTSFLPTILRLTEPGQVVRFYRNIPIMCLQPVHRSVLEAGRTAELVTGQGLAEWPEDLWHDLVVLRRRRQDPELRSTYRREQVRRLRENAGYQPIGVEEADQPN